MNRLAEKEVIYQALCENGGRPTHFTNHPLWTAKFFYAIPGNPKDGHGRMRISDRGCFGRGEVHKKGTEKGL